MIGAFKLTTASPVARLATTRITQTANTQIAPLPRTTPVATSRTLVAAAPPPVSAGVDLRAPDPSPSSAPLSAPQMSTPSLSPVRTVARSSAPDPRPLVAAAVVAEAAELVAEAAPALERAAYATSARSMVTPRPASSPLPLVLVAAAAVGAFVLLRKKK